jgi:ribosomal protein S18 acetylase RimI-like enzyme
MEFEIREMQIEDYNKAYTLWLNIEGLGLSEADSEENIRSYLYRNKGLSFVCDYKGEIIGTALCGHDGRRGFIYHVAVDKEYWSNGIGKRLVSQCLSKLKDEGILKCHLFVMNNNEIGNGFWNRSGWTFRDDFAVYSKTLID